MIDTTKMFEEFVSIDIVDKDVKDLLDKIMSLSTPMKFDDDFATEEELDHLEDELDRLNIRSPQSDTLLNVIRNTPALKSYGFGFI